VGLNEACLLQMVLCIDVEDVIQVSPWGEAYDEFFLGLEGLFFAGMSGGLLGLRFL